MIQKITRRNTSNNEFINFVFSNWKFVKRHCYQLRKNKCHHASCFFSALTKLSALCLNFRARIWNFGLTSWNFPGLCFRIFGACVWIFGAYVWIFRANISEFSGLYVWNFSGSTPIIALTTHAFMHTYHTFFHLCEFINFHWKFFHCNVVCVQKCILSQ